MYWSFDPNVGALEQTAQTPSQALPVPSPQNGAFLWPAATAFGLNLASWERQRGKKSVDLIYSENKPGSLFSFVVGGNRSRGGHICKSLSRRSSCSLHQRQGDRRREPHRAKPASSEFAARESVTWSVPALRMAGTTQRKLAVILVLAALCLQESLLQPAAEQRKPFFERFRRLEEQFRRFQEVTLLRLQEIAGNYNVSYNIDAKFDHLLSRQDASEAAANVSHAATEEELRQLKAWAKKLQGKAKKQDSAIADLEDSLQRRSREDRAEKEQEKALLANLTDEVAAQKEAVQATWRKLESLQKVLEGLQDALKTQGSKMDELERRLKTGLADNEVLLPGHLAAAHLLSQDHPEKGPEAADGQQPTLKKLRAKHQRRKKLHQESIRLAAAQSRKKEPEDGFLPGQKGSVPGQGMPTLPEPQALVQPPPAVEEGPGKKEVAGATRKPGTICNVGSMLAFPDASTENFAAFRPSFLAGLLELSLCSWVRTGAGYLGTILSYATEENDNKLVLHGRDAAPRNAVHFVVGDPAFRELPVGRILDGKWHHLCVLWSSVQGRYWFYVDRRVVSMGSRFRKGYEIPPGGSLVLGQEQDSLGGGFEPSESFVGFLAGLALWDRVLAPGEVSGIAVGKGLPRGPLLTLANVSALHGSVKKVGCACLEHCL